MKKGLVVGITFLCILIVLMSFVSAGWFADLFRKAEITGNVVSGTCSGGPTGDYGEPVPYEFGCYGDDSWECATGCSIEEDPFGECADENFPCMWTGICEEDYETCDELDYEWCETLSCTWTPDAGECTDNDNDGYYAEDGCGTSVDCDDYDATLHPGIEICDDDIDNNCNGNIDCDDSACDFICLTEEGCAACIAEDHIWCGVPDPGITYNCFNNPNACISGLVEDANLCTDYIAPVCIDHDAGVNNISIASSATGKDGITLYDSCSSSYGVVKEAICSEYGWAEKVYYDCPGECVSGACIIDETDQPLGNLEGETLESCEDSDAVEITAEVVCSDEDGGNFKDIPGSCTDANGEVFDTCETEGGTVIHEKVCSDNVCATSTGGCSTGYVCDAGACILEVSILSEALKICGDGTKDTPNDAGLNEECDGVAKCGEDCSCEEGWIESGSNACVEIPIGSTEKTKDLFCDKEYKPYEDPDSGYEGSSKYNFYVWELDSECVNVCKNFDKIACDGTTIEGVDGGTVVKYNSGEWYSMLRTKDRSGGKGNYWFYCNCFVEDEYKQELDNTLTCDSGCENYEECINSKCVVKEENCSLQTATSTEYYDITEDSEGNGFKVRASKNNANAQAVATCVDECSHGQAKVLIDGDIIDGCSGGTVVRSNEGEKIDGTLKEHTRFGRSDWTFECQCSAHEIREEDPINYNLYQKEIISDGISTSSAGYSDDTGGTGSSSTLKDGDEDGLTVHTNVILGITGYSTYPAEQLAQGINPYKQGIATGPNVETDVSNPLSSSLFEGVVDTNNTDYCLNNGQIVASCIPGTFGTGTSSCEVREHYCEGVNIVKTSIDCDRGCQNGACFEEEDCIETDAGIAPFAKGDVTIGVEKKEDVCANSALTEYYCSEEGELSQAIVPCSFGCNTENNACELPPDQTLETIGCDIGEGKKVSSKTRFKGTDDKTYYCHPVHLIKKLTLEEDGVCVGDYECVSNVCLEGECTSLKTELAEQKGLLLQIQKLLCQIKAIFTGDSSECTTE